MTSSQTLPITKQKQRGEGVIVARGMAQPERFSHLRVMLPLTAVEGKVLS